MLFSKYGFHFSAVVSLDNTILTTKYRVCFFLKLVSYFCFSKSDKVKTHRINFTPQDVNIHIKLKVCT